MYKSEEDKTKLIIKNVRLAGRFPFVVLSPGVVKLSFHCDGVLF